jgi:hypothetical protein
MKNLRQLSVAFVFTCALAVPAFAGQIETTVTAQPTPTPQAAAAGQIETTVAGQIETTGSVSEATAIDSATQAALNLIQTVLALF